MFISLSLGSQKKKEWGCFLLMISRVLILARPLKNCYWDFPGSPVVQNPPSNTGDLGSIPRRGTKIPHAMGQLSLSALTRETHLKLRCVRCEVGVKICFLSITFFSLFTLDDWLQFLHLWDEGNCRGPAPVDPGNSKWGRRWRGSGNNCLIKR